MLAARELMERIPSSPYPFGSPWRYAGGVPSRGGVNRPVAADLPVESRPINYCNLIKPVCRVKWGRRDSNSLTVKELVYSQSQLAIVAAPPECEISGGANTDPLLPFGRWALRG